MAMCFVAFGDYPGALRQITKGIKLFPKFNEGFNARAKIFNHMKKFEKAINDCYTSIKMTSQNPEGYTELGNALLGLNDFKQALQAYTKALK